MAARITRAKKKISTARIPYRVPSPGQLAERVSVVLEVVHLIFTTARDDLCPCGPGRRFLVLLPEDRPFRWHVRWRCSPGT
jgi:predicted RNA polymerase sigma factor